MFSLLLFLVCFFIGWEWSYPQFYVSTLAKLRFFSGETGLMRNEKLTKHPTLLFRPNMKSGMLKKAIPCRRQKWSNMCQMKQLVAHWNVVKIGEILHCGPHFTTSQFCKNVSFSRPILCPFSLRFAFCTPEPKLLWGSRLTRSDFPLVCIRVMQPTKQD